MVFPVRIGVFGIVVVERGGAMRLSEGAEELADGGEFAAEPAAEGERGFRAEPLT